MILKLDFAKAFNTIEHDAILAMHMHLGFRDRWILWIEFILSSGASAVLLNGVPSKTFLCRRGSGRGTLSLLFFCHSYGSPSMYHQ